MERKFKVGDKVQCIAGKHKFRTGYVLKIGNGSQPFYHIVWADRIAHSWSHENHLIPFGFIKEHAKEVEMNELKKMEVGKLYKSVGQKRIVKVLAVSTKGEVFVEGVGSEWCGHGSTINPSNFYNWKEYTEPKTIYINIFQYTSGVENCGRIFTSSYDSLDAAERAENNYRFIKRIETEISP